MKYFKDSATGAVYAFDDDVKVSTNKAGVVSFATAGDLPLSAPSTLAPCDDPMPGFAAENKVGLDKAAAWGEFVDSTSAPITITTAAGVTSAFDSNAESRNRVANVLAGYPSTLPAGFYWVSAANDPIPFTRADLQTLAAAMAKQEWDAFQALQNAKSAIRNA